MQQDLSLYGRGVVFDAIVAHRRCQETPLPIGNFQIFHSPKGIKESGPLGPISTADGMKDLHHVVQVVVTILGREGDAR